VDGKPVPQGKIHLTLAFLGEVPPTRIAAATSIGLAARAFDLAFDRLGQFRDARVAWAGCADAPAALLEVQSRLAAKVRAAGFALEDRPFAPHVTLVRRTGRGLPPTAIEPVAWRAREVALMRSETGTGRYSRLATWELED
jgi:RNA 2',3'-cyclic 3'-phosphodiesterase